MLRNQNFEMAAGDNKRLEFTVEDQDNLEHGSAIWAASQYLNGEPVLTKEGAGSITISENRVLVDLVPEDTQELESGTYYHELQITIEDQVYTAASGELKLHPTII